LVNLFLVLTVLRMLNIWTKEKFVYFSPFKSIVQEKKSKNEILNFFRSIYWIDRNLILDSKLISESRLILPTSEKYEAVSRVFLL
jgi:hypothetical protein